METEHIVEQIKYLIQKFNRLGEEDYEVKKFMQHEINCLGIDLVKQINCLDIEQTSKVNFLEQKIRVLESKLSRAIAKNCQLKKSLQQYKAKKTQRKKQDEWEISRLKAEVFSLQIELKTASKYEDKSSKYKLDLIKKEVNLLKYQLDNFNKNFICDRASSKDPKRSRLFEW